MSVRSFLQPPIGTIKAFCAQLACCLSCFFLYHWSTLCDIGFPRSTKPFPYSNVFIIEFSRSIFLLNPLSANPIKWSNTLKQYVGMLTNYLRVFGHFVGLVLKGLMLALAFCSHSLNILSLCLKVDC